MKPKVYIETSVISYYTSKPSRDIIVAAQQQLTIEWWDNYIQDFDVYVSPLVYDEISKGDLEASKRRISVITDFKNLKITDNVFALANEYYKLLQLPDRAKADAVHLSLACIHIIDYLISWNCVHIVGARVRKMIETYNSKNGLFIPILCTPQELLEV